MARLRYWDRTSLMTQHVIAQIFAPLTYLLTYLWMRVLRGYRLPQLRRFRASLLKQLAHQKGPILMCPNHLTLVDSMILIWALSPGWLAVLRPNFFPWNTPEKKNFAKSYFLRFLCYLGKCLFVVRQGSQAKNLKVMNQLKRLFFYGQSVMIFPEGTRSRSGRVDTESYSYGVGRIVEESRSEDLKPRVLCLYMRGRQQHTFSALPKRHESFHLDYALIDPRSSSAGLRAARDISGQIIQTLARLENAYFAGQRPAWE